MPMPDKTDMVFFSVFMKVCYYSTKINKSKLSALLKRLPQATKLPAVTFIIEFLMLSVEFIALKQIEFSSGVRNNNQFICAFPFETYLVINIIAPIICAF